MKRFNHKLVGLLAAPVLLLASHSQAQNLPANPVSTEPTPPPSAEICLTNACSAPLAKFKTLRDAIAAGDTLAVKAMGGSAQDVLAALNAQVEKTIDSYSADKSDKRQRWIARERSDQAHYADPAFGAFTFAPTSAIGMAPNAGMPVEGGGTSLALFILQRRTPTGCTEAIIIHDNGDGVPVEGLCSR